FSIFLYFSHLREILLSNIVHYFVFFLSYKTQCDTICITKQVYFLHLQHDFVHHHSALCLSDLECLGAHRRCLATKGPFRRKQTSVKGWWSARYDLVQAT